MYRDERRYGRDPSVVVRAARATFEEPLKWERRIVIQSAGVLPEPQYVFTCSLSDFFHEKADAWRGDAWEIIRRTPHLTYQILSKRTDRIRACLPPDWGEGYPNVWLGVSAIPASSNSFPARRLRSTKFTPDSRSWVLAARCACQPRAIRPIAMHVTASHAPVPHTSCGRLSS